MNTIRYALSVTWKEIQLILKDRGSLAIAFLLPLLLSLMMGGTNLMAWGDEDATILVKVCLVNEDADGDFGREVAKAIQSIHELGITVYDTAAEAEGQVAKGEAAAAIIIPASFSADINAHIPTVVEVIVDPGQPESASIVTGIMNQVVDEVTVWGEVQYGVRTMFEESGVLAGATAEQQGAVAAQTLGVIMTTLNEMRADPVIAVVAEDLEGVKIEGGGAMFFALLFPGFTVMFIFFNITMSASALLNERESGTLRRLVAAPIPRGVFMAGKMLAYVLLSCVQVVVLFSVARIFFEMPMGQSPLALVVLSLVVAMVSTALGMMVAGLAKSASQASNVGVLMGFVLGALGGCIPMFAKVPLVRAEGFLGVIANLTPQGHALEAYYRLMAENGTFVDILPPLGILAAMGVVFFLVATWRFKYE